MTENNQMKPNTFVTHGKTRLVQGTITHPEAGNLRLVFVPCGKLGKPDTQLHAIINKRWRSVAAELKGWFSSNITFKMGNINTTATQSDVWVVHALCFNENNEVDERALFSCVKKAADMCRSERASLHVSTLSMNTIPGLADLLNTQLIEKGLSVYFYEEKETV